MTLNNLIKARRETRMEKKKKAMAKRKKEMDALNTVKSVSSFPPMEALLFPVRLVKEVLPLAEGFNIEKLVHSYSNIFLFKQTFSQSPLLQKMSQLREETGLSCIICREGYKCDPKKVCFEVKYVGFSK